MNGFVYLILISKSSGLCFLCTLFFAFLACVICDINLFVELLVFSFFFIQICLFAIYVHTFYIESFLFQLILVRLVSSFTSSLLCARIPGLTLQQKQLCTESPDALIALGEGHQLGAQECQYQFRGHRWNCTKVWKKDVFGHVMFVGKIKLINLKAATSAA